MSGYPHYWDSMISGYHHFKDSRILNLRTLSIDIRKIMSGVLTCGAMLISGQAAERAIVILSESEEVAAWAQHEPQYWGRGRNFLCRGGRAQRDKLQFTRILF